MLNKKGLLIFITFCFAVLLVGCGEKIEPGNSKNGELKVVKATVVTAKISHWPSVYEAVGTVNAKTVTTLSGKIMGAVRNVYVKEGDRVFKNQRLAKIDDRSVSAMLDRAKAKLAEAKRGKDAAEAARDAAKAGFELADATYRRYLNLMKDESASAQEFDEIKSRYHQAQASLKQSGNMVSVATQRVKQAGAAVSAAVVGKHDSVVLAPYNGKIREKMIDVGDLISPGKPMFDLEKEKDYLVELTIPEQYIHAVRLNRVVKISVDSLGGKIFEGKTSEIFPAADKKSRSFSIKVTIPFNPELRSGMFARVFIPLEKADMLLIPLTAVIHTGQLTGVYVVDKEKVAGFRLIRTGKVYGKSVEVISGLKNGERYVVTPPSTISSGVRVEVGS